MNPPDSRARRRRGCLLLLAVLAVLLAPVGTAGAEDGKEHTAAVALWTRKLEEAAAARDPARWAYAARRLAGLHAQTGAYREARRLLQDVLRWAESTRDRRTAAVTLAALGIVCENLGDYPMGVAHLAHALDLAIELKLPAVEAASLGALGVLQMRLGEHHAALEYLQRALRKRQALEDERGRAATLANIGIVRLAMGAYGPALENFEEALGIQDALRLTSDKARTLADIAGAWERLGAYRKAARNLEAARALCEKSGHRSDLASVLTGLGRVEVLLGDYAAAIGRHERALEILAALGQRQRYAAALGNLGAIYEGLGNTEQALELHERALDVFVALRDRVGQAACLRRVGALYGRLGRGERALVALERALRLCRDLRDDTAEVLVLGSLGNAYLAAGKLAAAKERQVQALDLARRLGARDITASVLGNLGLVLLHLGDTAEAVRLQEEALAAARALGLRRTVLLNRWGLALARLSQGDAEAARAQVRLAAEEIDASVAGLDDVAGPDAREVWAGLFDVGVLASAALEDVEGAFACMESGRARSLLDALGGRGTLAALTLPPDLAEAEARARAREHRALLEHRAARRSRRLLKIQRVGRELEAARKEVAAVVARTQREARAAADIVHPTPPAIDVVQARLAPDEALVVYALVGARTLAVLITHEARHLIELGPSQAVRSACAALELDHPESRPGRAVMDLRKLLVDPLQLPPAVKRLLVCPHDAISYVPMTLLVPGRDVVNVPSAASYVLLGRTEQARGTDVLALGDPAYGSVRSGRKRGGRLSGKPLPRLHATKAEARAVGDRVLLGRAATVSNFFAVLAERERWRAVHFACHGIVDPQRPFQSALALTPEASSDGYLTALDVIGRSVPADLTVLSGCETGRGRLYRAEGIVGLTRAFMFAGSPRVLCSLWKVDDEATRALMVKFYELWNPEQGTGLPAATALRQAQAHVRSVKKWRHPYFWAAWVLWGLPE